MRRSGAGSSTVRASLSKTALHGLVGWGVLIGVVASFLSVRVHSALSYRDPLPPLVVHLSAEQMRSWKTMPMYTRAVPVLEYHGISGPPSYLTISRYLFAKQMLALKVAGFHPISIAQYVKFLHHNYRGLPTRPILLTFDDGRLDAYRAALSIIRAEHFHAVDIVVPGWVTSNIRFSQNWQEMRQLEATGEWDVQAHFGFGHESIPINAAGRLGGAFADLEWYRGQKGRPGHLETFAHFKRRFTTNMLFAIKELRAHIPGYKPYAMAIPRGDYGEAYTNDPRIEAFVISWLDRHFQAVFGGDYLSRSPHERRWIGGKNYGRMAKGIEYRMTMGQRDILPVLFCRLKDYALDTRIWHEYRCYHRGKKKPRRNDNSDGDDGDSSLPALGAAERTAPGLPAASGVSPGAWAAPAGRRPRSE
ncbi:MAG TPA: polysaccharide deacetylase family protein [Streptosporangiaceae bacterium]|nr:polysaccharide deacetylase family protein [Streptosporangiaceae bacterium]